MKVVVVGSTGGSGRAAVRALLAAGHEVTAFARHTERLGTHSDRLHLVNGDAMEPADVERAVRGQDAVVVTLGISENALKVRVFGPAHTPIDVRSVGTRNVISAMRLHGVRKLVVQTSYGVGSSRDKLGLANRMFFELILKPQIADTETQNREVSESGLDWVLVQPVHLTDDPEDGPPFASAAGVTQQMKVSRSSVGRFLAEAAQTSAYVHASVAVSAALGW